MMAGFDGFNVVTAHSPAAAINPANAVKAWQRAGSGKADPRLADRGPGCSSRSGPGSGREAPNYDDSRSRFL